MKTPTPPPLAPELAADAPHKTLEPDREARRALANTLVLGQTGPQIRVVSDDPEIPTISLGHGTGAEAPADLEVVAPLGVGGTGHVFLAHQRSLHRDVAVKVLKDDAADLGVCLVYEARVATRIDHPNVVPVYLLGKTSAGMPVLVMKHIRGVSWLELLERPDHRTWADLAGPAQSSAGARERLLAHLEIFLAVCNGVGAAHRQGIVHRDIKPSNVMVAGPGEVYLMDWGIAFDRAAPPPPLAGSLVGTPAFMAPEMLSGVAADVDERADIFMLGASLHFALTGRHRNAGTTNESAIAALRDLAPFAYEAAVPEELAAICNRATERDRQARFGSIAELREAVQGFLYHHESFRTAERVRAQVDAVAAAPPDEAVARALDEARYVLHGALEVWPDNPLARAQLERVRARQVEVELARGNVVAARARLAELAAPPADLAAEVAAAEADEAQRRERDARHAAYERELDLRTGARIRRWFFGLFAVYGLVAGATFAVLRAGGDDQSGRRAVAFSIVSIIFYGSMVAVARRQILANRINRIIVGLFGTFIGFNLVHRVIALVLDGSPRLTLAIDTLGIAMIASIGALMISPRLWVVPAVVGAVSLPLALAVPASSQAVFVLSALFMVWRMLREWGRDPLA